MNTKHCTNNSYHQPLRNSHRALRRELATLRAENARLAGAKTSASEQSRRLETEQLRLMVEAMPAPVAISRVADGRLVYANAILGDLMGTPANELVGRETRGFYDNPADCARLLSLLREQGQVDRQEVLLRRLDGTPVWVEVSLRWLTFHEEPAILAALHDITHCQR